MEEISVVIPVFNEEKGLPELYTRLTTSLNLITDNYKLIFVDDGSKDNTLAYITGLSNVDKHVSYISFSRNFGHQVAISAGLDFAQGNTVVIIDGDMQDPPELIPDLYKKYKEGYNVVYAKRSARRGEKIYKKVAANIFYRTLRSITTVDIPLDTGDFRLIDRKIVNVLKKMPEKTKFFRGQIAWIGFKQTSVEFERDYRKYGEAGYTVSKLVKLAFDGITGFSEVPMRLALWMGFIISGGAFIILLFTIYYRFIMKDVFSGTTVLVICFMFIGGIQLLTIGIIGEYLNRINNETRNRPLYIIEDTNLAKEPDNTATQQL